MPAAGHALAIGPVTPIALTGHIDDPLGPGQAGLSFVQLNNSTPTINILGQVCFRGQNSVMPANGTGSLIGLSSGTGGVWLWDGSQNSVRAQIGDPTPDALTYTFSATGGGFGANSIASNGTIYYKNESNSNFVQDPAAAKINRMGTLAPGIAGGTATFSATRAGSVALATDGGYLVAASMANAVGGIPDRSKCHRGREGAIRAPRREISSPTLAPGPTGQAASGGSRHGGGSSLTSPGTTGEPLVS